MFTDGYGPSEGVWGIDWVDPFWPHYWEMMFMLVPAFIKLHSHKEISNLEQLVAMEASSVEPAMEVSSTAHPDVKSARSPAYASA